MNDRLEASGDERDGRATRECGRADDLVAYLYGEASPSEGRLFAAHVESCAVCRDELTAFGGVRRSVGVWREEVLRAAPQVDLSGAFARAPADAGARPTRRRSAAAAMREFFALSPTWLRAVASVAVLAVCALATLSIVRTEIRWDEDGVAFRTGTPTQTVVQSVEFPAPGTLTEQQAEEMALRRTNEALEAQRVAFALELKSAVARAREESSSSNRPVPVLASDVRQTQRGGLPVVKKRAAGRQNLAARQQDEDEGLPGLYDLLREAN